MSLADVTIYGNVGKDPEQRYTQSGTQIVSFSVAVNVGRKQPDGSWSDETNWYTVQLFGQQGERALDTIRKGQKILVMGDLKLEEWVGKEGEKRTTPRVTARSYRIVQKARDEEGDPTQEDGRGGYQARREAAPAGGGGHQGRGRQPARPADDLEDLPF